MNVKHLFPAINYKIISNTRKNKLIENKVYTSNSIGQLDLKCFLLDYYNISTTNIVKRGKKNVKINWVYSK